MRRVDREPPGRSVNGVPGLPVRPLLAIAGLLCATTLTVAQVSTPQTIKVQGFLNQNGSPANGTFTMTFKLYDQQFPGGTQIGPTETESVQVNSGIYDVDLTSFSASHFSTSDRYLEVAVGSDPPMAPRLRMASAPYCYEAEKLDGFDGADFVKKTGDMITGNLQVAGTIYSTTGGFKFPDGTVQATAATQASVGNTLDQAYNQGGPGAGRTINANSGAVNIAGTGGLTVNGVVGIGTISPDSWNPVVKLDVRGDIEAQALTTGGAAVETYNTLRNRVVVLGSYNQNGLIGLFDSTGTTENVLISAASNSATFFNNGGNVGIGTTTPSAKLEVAGHTKTQVLEITGGSDLAEPFDIGSEALPAGAVVVIDDANPGKLKLSEQPYDRRVAGILSGAGGINPGLTLSQQGKTEVGQHVALAGRVYALADASNGEIRPGDLLTTSATPGHAMKVTDYQRAQGAVIGKAMSSLDEGDGLVLVLVNLQ